MEGYMLDDIVAFAGDGFGREGYMAEIEDPAV
jgi:hypothetical protein